MDTIPERVKEQIPIQRILMNMMYLNGKIPQRIGTDAEALAYMYPRTMEAPMDRDWVDIYVYLGNQLAKSCGTEIPDDIKMESLPEDLQRKLDHLKRWIYEKRVAARHERGRQELREKKEEEQVQRQSLQPSMFEF
jgi:CO dehydrogenase/acetyl-CoA synthase beta subunit